MVPTVVVQLSNGRSIHAGMQARDDVDITHCAYWHVCVRVWVGGGGAAIHIHPHSFYCLHQVT